MSRRAHGWTHGSTNAPVVIPASFTISAPASVDELVGTVNFTGTTPTAWSITGGDAPHNFDIYLQGDGTAHLRTVASGTPPPLGAYNLTVVASNANGQGSAAIGVTVGGTPVVTSRSFNLSLPTSLNTAVGTMPATNSPTAWAIIAGDPSGFYAIDSSGNITVTSAGASGITAGTYTPTCQATNVLGSGTGTATITAAAASAPVVSSDSFNLTIPATTGTVVGTMTATNSPTSWSITAGNSSGFFAIDNSGVITVTSTGASGLTANTYTLTCQATNGAGNGSGTATITAATAGSTYDNVNNYPSSANRPVYTSSTHTLVWIGPTVTGGDSSTNAAGASTTTDVSHSLVLTVSGTVTSSAANQVFVGLSIENNSNSNACITINHTGCQILRCHFKALGTGFPSCPIAINAANCLIEDCDINGGATANTQNQIVNTGGVTPPALTVRRCSLSQGEKGIGVNHTNSTYVDNWFNNYAGGDCDMVQLYSSASETNHNNVLIQHNTFDGTNNTAYPSAFNNSTINCSNWPAGNFNTITFNHNMCMLSNSTHQVLLDGHFSSGTFSGVTITNNGFYSSASYILSSGTANYTSSGNYVAATQLATSGSPTNGTGQV